jgi:hypothetical protein
MILPENIIPLTRPQRENIKQLAQAVTAVGPTQAMVVPHGMPADACQYAVVSQVSGKELIRCWSSAEACYYAAVDPSLALGTLAYVEAVEAENSDLSARLSTTKEQLAAARRERDELQAKFCPNCDRTNWDERVRDGCDICKLPDADSAAPVLQEGEAGPEWVPEYADFIHLATADGPVWVPDRETWDKLTDEGKHKMMQVADWLPRELKIAIAAAPLMGKAAAVSNETFENEARQWENGGQYGG